MSIALYNIVIFSIINDSKKAESLMIQATKNNINITNNQNINLFSENSFILPFNISNNINNNTSINVYELFKFAQKIGCNFSQNLTLFLPVIQFLVNYYFFL